MGTSGVELFDDDVACDVRDDYRQLLEDRCEDQEAIDRVLAQHLESLLDSDDEQVVVLALAVSASQLGRLTPALRDRAVGMIDAGDGLGRWADDVVLLPRRVEALARVREQLTGPQPARGRVQKARRKLTPARPGDVYAVEVDPGVFRAVRVTRVVEDQRFTLPEIQVLDWLGDRMPTTTDMVYCPDLAPRPRLRTRLTIAGAGDDPTEFGFVVVGSIPARPGDDAISRAGGGTFWRALAERLRNLGNS